MPFEEQYRQQVTLLLRTLPLVTAEPIFALKGGTAINLFVRDMPRLSVDIDLTYLPVQPRDKSLAAIDAGMKRIATGVRERMQGASVHEGRSDRTVTKLLVRERGVQIKIEVTPVLRGCVFDPDMRNVTAAVESQFGFGEARVVSFQDLYAGKLVAALDRQHPRDLFDVRDLLANEGIDDRLRQTFIVYLLSHHRPMGEVLACSRKPLDKIFRSDFEGMTDTNVTVDELADAREAMVRTLVPDMPDAHKRFLLSFERGAPEWDLLGLPAASDLPAVRWRQQNLDTLKATKRQALVDHLAEVLARRGQA
jgi:predicted nucleotidyltransferase component of viral defense system